jgi:hypothetical protein
MCEGGSGGGGGGGESVIRIEQSYSRVSIIEGACVVKMNLRVSVVVDSVLSDSCRSSCLNLINLCHLLRKLIALNQLSFSFILRAQTQD